MATECNQVAILDFLKEKGGRVKNTELINHFRFVFPVEPGHKSAARQRFKSDVDNVAFVKAEGGVKYVCLRKKFRVSVNNQDNNTVNDETKTPETESVQVKNQEEKVSRYPSVSEQVDSRRVSGTDSEPSSGEVTLPGSGYGNDSQVRVPDAFSSSAIWPDKRDDKSRCHEVVCIVEEVDSNSGEMGNRASLRREKRESQNVQGGAAPNIPKITVIEASPLPADASMFNLPEPVQTGGAAGLIPTDKQTETLSLEIQKESDQICGVTRHQNSKRSQHRPADSDEDEGLLDAQSLSGSEGNITPKGSRKHFIEVMMNSSPQVRRSMVNRNSVYLSSRSDSDSASLASSNPDEDRASVTLDPMEHEWMMCASDGEWDSLYRLLTTEPSLVLRKDFVTGFTCLHWAAKHGKPELVALIISFAKQHHIPINVDVRSNTGYTPLHVAAMHNHMEVVKLLVSAYKADVEVRDYSGRKACQYLTDNVTYIQDIIGAYELSEAENMGSNDRSGWSFSRVLQSNLKPLRLRDSDGDSVDGESHQREKPLRRKSSLSRMKPKLQRLRWRTSQIVHSTSFHDTEEKESSGRRNSFRFRPKTHFFG